MKRDWKESKFSSWKSLEGSMSKTIWTRDNIP